MDYHLLKMVIFPQEVAAQNKNLDLVLAKSLVQEVGATLVESVLVLKGYWFLITSFSIFLHGTGTIDDCADKSRFGFQEKPIAFIQRKTGFGSSSFELILRFGNFEALANGGSALQKLPNEPTGSVDTPKNNHIFINKGQKEFVTENRIFNSARFVENGFKPVNPLSIESEHIYVCAASLVIETYALKCIYDDDTTESMEKNTTSKSPKKINPVLSSNIRSTNMKIADEAENTYTLKKIDLFGDLL
ncbi:hypothetical protein EDC94DRAFT_642032 [Helicostylum pulchrum]|nr:hypothetical protein EDC94DRAFT_642032 [Helicostylum pulchrum]